MGFFSIEPLFRSETAFKYKMHLALQKQKAAESLCDHLLREYAGRQEGYRAMCVALLTQLIVEISRWFDQSLGQTSMRREFQGKERTVEAAISYMEQNFTKEITVDDVARFSFISSSRLSHVFKDTTGLSLLDYLTRIRLDQACAMLADGTRNVSEIACSLGFHDASYFSRLFRKELGCTPSDYRKKTVLS